jgi:hypothetical protein
MFVSDLLSDHVRRRAATTSGATRLATAAAR